MPFSTGDSGQLCLGLATLYLTDFKNYRASLVAKPSQFALKPLGKSHTFLCFPLAIPSDSIRVLQQFYAKISRTFSVIGCRIQSICSGTALEWSLECANGNYGNQATNEQTLRVLAMLPPQ